MRDASIKLSIIFLVCLLLNQIVYTQSDDYQKKAITSPENSLPVFYEKLKEKLQFECAWHDSISDPIKWRNNSVVKLRDIIIPRTDSIPFDPILIDEIDRGSYLARKVVFNISAESRVLALLLVPKGDGPFPAALMLHDHGAKFDIGKEKFVQTWDDSSKLSSSIKWGEKYFSGRFPGDELAKQGYVVLSFDAFGWGDRSVEGFNKDSQQALAANLFNLGTSFAEIIAAEDVRAAKFLATLSIVDKRKIAAVGFSMGAFRAWQVAALSRDITATIAVCWMSTLKELMVPGNNQLKGQSAFTMIHPGIFRYFDYPDIASLLVPKPLILLAGDMDKLFPQTGVKLAFNKIGRVYEAFGVPEYFYSKTWEGKSHEFTVDMQVDAFKRLTEYFENIR